MTNLCTDSLHNCRNGLQLAWPLGPEALRIETERNIFDKRFRLINATLIIVTLFIVIGTRNFRVQRNFSVITHKRICVPPNFTYALPNKHYDHVHYYDHHYDGELAGLSTYQKNIEMQMELALTVELDFHFLAEATARLLLHRPARFLQVVVALQYCNTCGVRQTAEVL
jgi:hypothetical protein